jgi:hypothetical protein
VKRVRESDTRPGGTGVRQVEASMGKAAVVLEAWRNNVESVYRVVERLSRLASRAVGLLTSACRAKAKWRYTCHGSGARRWSGW